MKRIILILLTLAAVCAAACQKTPETPPIIIVEITPSPTPDATPTPEPTPEPTPTPYMGAFGAKFGDKFVAAGAEAEITDTSYRSESLYVSITSEQITRGGLPVTYYLADIYVRDIDAFRTCIAGDKYAQDSREWITEAAERCDPVIMINGSFYSIQYASRSHAEGLLIVNSHVYRDEVSTRVDQCVLLPNGEIRIFPASTASAAEILALDPLQAWNFGPVLVRDGEAVTGWDESETINGIQPRTVLGYYEPGHYCLVVVDGRQGSYSRGLTMNDLAKLMDDFGVTTAYNLDGGRTSVMYFMGEYVNRPYDGGRECSDFLYFTDSALAG